MLVTTKMLNYYFDSYDPLHVVLSHRSRKWHEAISAGGTDFATSICLKIISGSQPESILPQNAILKIKIRIYKILNTKLYFNRLNLFALVRYALECQSNIINKLKCLYI